MSDTQNDRSPERENEENELPAQQHQQQGLQARPQGWGLIWNRLMEGLTKLATFLKRLPEPYIIALKTIFAILWAIQARRLYQRGQYIKAHALLHRASQILQEVFGEKHPFTLASMGNTALCLISLGRSSQALPLIKRCIEFRREIHGEKYPDSLTDLNNLAGCLDELGSSAEALPIYEQCLDLRTEVLGAKHPRTITTLNNLAGCLSALGRSSEALPLYKQCLDLRTEVQGAKHPDTISSLNNLAGCLDYLGRSAEALSIHERCLELSQEVLGKKHPDTLLSLGNLALCLDQLERSAEALRLYQDCLELSREIHGEKHPSALTSFNNLACLLVSLDRSVEALPLHQKALEICKDVLGEKHPRTLRILNNLTGCLNDLKRYTEALPLLLASLLSSQDLMGNTRALPDEIRRSYIGQFNGILPVSLSLAIIMPTVSSELLDRLYIAVLRQKLIESELHALPQEAVLLERYPQFAPQLQERTALQQEYSHLYLTKPLEAAERIAELEKQIQQLNASLMQQIPELKEEDKRLSLDRKVIALSLPAGSTLVEYVHYRRYDFASKLWAEERYAAFVLTSGEEGTLRLVDLGEAAPIEALVQTFRHQQTGMRGEKEEGMLPLPSNTSLPQQTQRKGPKPAVVKKAKTPIEQLIPQIWKPLLMAGVSQERLYVVPDGQLGSLPFELIAQQPDVTYLAQATDLPILAARRQDLSLSLSRPLLLADPDYGTPRNSPPPAPDETENTTDAPLSRAGNLECNRLPGSYLEALRIQNYLQTHPYLRGEARTALLTEFPRPSVLHLSTHGFSMEDLPLPITDLNLRIPSSLEPSPTRLIPTQAQPQLNPMLRCGIAFAGARDFLAGNSAEGVLNAQDFTGFDLRNSRILLSCCSTAAAVKRDGRGLLGLRTALFYAGARTLILTLWKVDDLATGIFMEELYRLLFAEKREVNDALNRAKTYLKTITIGQLKQTFWLNGAAKEALLDWKQSHPCSQEASEDDAVLELLVQKLEALAAEEETHTPFAAECYWAPFVCYGDTSPFA